MFSSVQILLKDSNITLHIIVYTNFYSLRYQNSGVCFPNFGAARTPYLMYDVYTNDSLHGVCFPTVSIGFKALFFKIVYHHKPVHSQRKKNISIRYS